MGTRDEETARRPEPTRMQGSSGGRTTGHKAATDGQQGKAQSHGGAKHQRHSGRRETRSEPKGQGRIAK